ncbi:MAG: hypothetical protein WEB37_07405 [Bacteroidota bacterium]
MIQDLLDLYSNSGEWGDPILLVTGVLFAAGWVMLFTVRLIKKFVFYSIIALVLPNAVGISGYVENLDDFQERIVERGKELSEEMLESAEDLAFSPIYFGLAGSVLTLTLGIAGIIKTRRRKTKTQTTSSPHP